jgi:hypothetical protein
LIIRSAYTHVGTQRITNGDNKHVVAMHDIDPGYANPVVHDDDPKAKLVIHHPHPKSAIMARSLEPMSILLPSTS